MWPIQRDSINPSQVFKKNLIKLQSSFFYYQATKPLVSFIDMPF
jgi:hypothetical protein